MSDDSSEVPPDDATPPQDYARLRDELTSLATALLPTITDLWPRLDDHKYRWELHRFGLSRPYDQLVVGDIIADLVSALTSIGAANNALLSAHTRAMSHDPGT